MIIKRFFILLMVLAAWCAATFAQGAKIKSCTIVPNDDWSCLTVKATFDIWGCKGVNGAVNTYFYFSNGTALKDFNNSYYTSNGEVANHTDICPGYDSSTYTDYEVTIPVSELHCSNDAFHLYYDLTVTSNKKLLAKQYKNYFDITLQDGKMTSFTLCKADGSKTRYYRTKCLMCYGGTCKFCGGTGHQYNMYGERPCVCNGTGKCTYCHGAGYLASTSNIAAPSKSNKGNSYSGSGYYGGGFSGGSSYSGGSGSSRSSSSSSSSRVCPSCNGTGKGADQITYSPNYTGNDNSQYCSQCGRVMPAHSHRRPMCRTCNGRGRI